MITSRLVHIPRSRLALSAIVVCAAGCGFLLRFVDLGRSLWLDEAWVANSATAQSLANVFYYQPWLQTSPPLFLLLVRAWVAVFGLTNSSLRAVPFVMGVLALLCMGLAVNRVLTRAYAFFAWTFFALSPIAMDYSVTLKQYSSELAASTVIMLTCILYLERTTNLRFWLLVAAVGMGLVLAYVTVFALPGIVLVVCFSSLRVPADLLSSSRTRLAHWLRGLTLGGIAGAIFLAEYFFFIRPNISPSLYAYWGRRGSDTRSLVQVAGSAAYSFVRLLPLPDLLLTRPKIVAPSVAILILIGLTVICLRSHVARLKWLSLLVMSGTPCLIVIICQSFWLYPISGRTDLFILPFLILLLGCNLQLAAIFAVSRLRFFSFSQFLNLSLIGLTLLTILVVFRKSPKESISLNVGYEDVQSAVAFLHDHINKSDLLWVHASASESFKLYGRMLGWTGAPVRYGQTGWPCCPRGVSTRQGASTDASVVRDVDNGIPPAFARKIWLLYTTRSVHWDFVGLDEPQLTKRILLQRGCTQIPTPSFVNIAVTLFDCDRNPARQVAQKNSTN